MPLTVKDDPGYEKRGGGRLQAQRSSVIPGITPTNSRTKMQALMNKREKTKIGMECYEHLKVCKCSTINQNLLYIKEFISGQNLSNMILWRNKPFLLDIILCYKSCFRCDTKHFIEKITEYFFINKFSHCGVDLFKAIEKAVE